MSRNKKLTTVAPHFISNGVNCVYAHQVLEAMFGDDYYLKVEPEVQTAALKSWMERNNAHYYAEEKWLYDADDRMYPGFREAEGVRQAKLYGNRWCVMENLS